ncbi:polyphenol oxidase family protein [Arthrobacter sp.]|uniref:polyphenol oxidase family protein n=1 Tax=Arthrobacter sp. TaxID=1667 RepID=UPI003A8CDA52
MLRYEFNGPTPAQVAFTSVAEGNLALHVGDRPAEVLQRRRSLEAGLGLGAGAVQFMNQTHSVLVHEVRSTASGPQDTVGGGTGGADAVAWGPDADAMVSPDGTSALAVLVADCLPVVFAATGDDGGLVSAVAHAGRQGLLGGILQNIVDAIVAAGGRDLHAWIGPAVCGACYEVPAQMASEADSVMPGIAVTSRWGTSSLDLPGAAGRLLSGLGVQVAATGVCTLEDPDYFSYRRDQQHAGRLAGIVWPASTGAPGA